MYLRRTLGGAGILLVLCSLATGWKPVLPTHCRTWLLKLSSMQKHPRWAHVPTQDASLKSHVQLFTRINVATVTTIERSREEGKVGGNAFLLNPNAIAHKVVDVVGTASYTNN